MNRIDRLTAILVQLQGKRVVRAQEIADRFGMSLRTVYRDVKALQEAGVPIGAEAGTGYYIVEGYHLPPVMFNRSEAAALLTGEKLMEKFSDHSNRQQFSNAMQKIRAVLRGTDKDFLESLDDTIAVLRHRPTDDQFPNRFLTDIQEALARQRVLSIEYYSYYSDAVNRREVEPVGIFHMHGHWHLIGYCRMRKDYRDFRADRIKSLHPTEQAFDKSNRMTLQEYLSRSFEANTEHHEVVRVIFEQSAVKYIGEQKYYYGLVEETAKEGCVEMTFMYSNVHFLTRWLLTMGKHVTVQEPESVRDLMRRHVKELMDHHGC